MITIPPSLSRFPVAFLEAVSLHTLYGNLGIRLELVRMNIVPDGIYVTIWHLEKDEAHIRAGDTPDLPNEAIAALWQEFLTEWNDGRSTTDDERRAVMHSSYACKNATGIIGALASAHIIAGAILEAPPDPSMN